MHIKFYNTPESDTFQNELSEVVQPPFLSYQPDWELINRLREECSAYTNILIVAHGGSVNSFIGLYNAFIDLSERKVKFLTTTDPDYIDHLKHKMPIESTLVVAISKSGETVTQLEALMHFLNYPLLVISTPGSTLYQIGERVGAKLVAHPSIGGRYTGTTEVALLPAALCGFNVKELYAGAAEYYTAFNKDNPAWQAASMMWQLERDQGYSGVFMPFYSHYLFPFSQLIVQLCHESFGKSGIGQTYFAHEAPESQHHTNQRFFGGRRNLAGFFVSQESFAHDDVITVPQNLQQVSLKDQHLSLLDKLPLSKSLEFELQGTVADAEKQGIPMVHLQVADRSFKEMGRFMAFWQLYAIYSSLLRGVNAFDQPQVEFSKEISFNKRLEYKDSQKSA
jgi:glucose-6-phosphate isomerase